MTIGEKILEIRQKKKLTQQELAKVLNVTNIAISRWENGKTLPDVEMIKKISDIYGISVGELYSCIDEVKTNNYDNYDFEKIWKYNKYTIISCILLILAILSFVYRFYYLGDYYGGAIFDNIRYFQMLLFELFYIIFPALGVSFEIVHFVHLFSYSKTKYYRKEYNKTLIIYGLIFLVFFIFYIASQVVMITS